MKTFSLHFNLHHSVPIRKFSFFELGKKHPYFDEMALQRSIEQQAIRYYLPLLNAFLTIQSKSTLKFSLSISGIALDLLANYAPRILEPLKKLSSNGKIEFVASSYSQGFSFLCSQEIFEHQINDQARLIDYHFSQQPTYFYNWEGVYSNKLGSILHELGFKGAFYHTPINSFASHSNTINTHPIHSDFFTIPTSNPGRYWKQNSELTAQFEQLKKVCFRSNEHEHLNLTFNFNTFAMQFERNKQLIQVLEQNCQELTLQGIKCVHPSEINEPQTPFSPLNIPNYTFNHEIKPMLSTPFTPLQKEVIKQMIAIQKEIKIRPNQPVYKDWQQLFCVDNFLYFNEKMQHPHLNGINDSYSYFTSLMNIISDLKIRLEDIKHFIT